MPATLVNVCAISSSCKNEKTDSESGGSGLRSRSPSGHLLDGSVEPCARLYRKSPSRRQRLTRRALRRRGGSGRALFAKTGQPSLDLPAVDAGRRDRRVETQGELADRLLD